MMIKVTTATLESNHGYYVTVYGCVTTEGASLHSAQIAISSLKFHTFIKIAGNLSSNNNEPIGIDFVS